MRESRVPREAWDLAAQFCDAQISAADLQTLSRRLHDDPALCDWFSRYMAIHAHLQWEMVAARTANSSDSLIVEPAPAGPISLNAGGAMTPEFSSHLLAELQCLVDLLCRGGATTEQRARIEQLTSNSPALRRSLIESIQRHAAAGQQDAELSDRPAQPTLLGFLGASAPHAGTHSVRLWALAVGVALAFWGFWAYFIQTSRQPPANRVAVEPHSGVRLLQAGPDCRFRQTSAVRTGDHLAVGKSVQLEAGQIELAFASGARAVLEGPATFEVRSDNGGFLQIGKFAARVPPQAVGFTLETPTARVVDMGTEFGVEVDDEKQTSVQVFEGRVQMSASAGSTPERATSPGPPCSLTAGQAARTDPRSSTVMAMEFSPQRFARPSVSALSSTDVAHRARPGGNSEARETTADDWLPQNFAEYGQQIEGFQDFFASRDFAPGWFEVTKDQEFTAGSTLNFTLPGDGTLHVNPTRDCGDPNKLLYRRGTAAQQTVLAMMKVVEPLGASSDGWRGGVSVCCQVESADGIALLLRHGPPAADAFRFYTQFIYDHHVWGPMQRDYTPPLGSYNWLRLTYNGTRASSKIWPADGKTSEPAEYQASWAVTAEAGVAGLVGNSTNGDGEFWIKYVLIRGAGLPLVRAGVRSP